MITLLNLETCVDLHLRFVVLLRLHLLQYCQLFLMDFFQSEKHRDSLVVKLILFVHLYALVFQVVVLLLELSIVLLKICNRTTHFRFSIVLELGYFLF